MTDKKSAVYAGVYVLELPLAADRIYDYSVPEHLVGQVRPGTIVKVPFSRGNHSRLAVVVRISPCCEYDKVKPVLAVATDRVSLDEEMLGLCSFIKERTFCTFTDAVHTVAGPVDKIAAGKLRAVAEYSYSITEAGRSASVRGSVRQRILECLREHTSLTKTELKACGASSKQLDELCNAGLLTCHKTELFRNSYERSFAPSQANALSPAQQQAFDELASELDADEARAALLYGITGSGKTRVIKALIDRAVSTGRSVIVLVPEISLTPQTVDLFCSFYGTRVAVLHSSLSPAERFDARRRIESGEVDVVIGTRSAVFAPLKNLGMIVLDEEQEHTYKSDMSPKYHTKDIARYRAAYHKALMLLSSATPSFESFYKAESSSYKLVRLTERYGEAKLPEVIVADRRLDSAEADMSVIGSVLSSEIQKNLDKNEQSILFVNRRGYNNFVSCVMCGEVISCPNCSVSLTLHKKKNSKSGMLMCHYCNHREPLPEKCPSCQSTHLNFKGFGTQLAETELAEKFPKARILRMDADTVSGRSGNEDTTFNHEQILKDFREHKADILLGTQMVTKGHDFPDVTLVGIVNADSALYLDDYRATERAFSLITQVIGRAGRASKPGRAVIQTYNPDNETLLYASKQDYDSFYGSAIKLRRALVFPPFCDFALLTLSSDKENELFAATNELDKRLRELIGKGGEYSNIAATAFRPIEAPVYKVNNIYRMRLVIKCRFTKRCRELISLLLNEFTQKYTSVSLSADINPTNI
ncbi:MAG: primosomal protein N' [Clostridia bacterium]|nr:primosomal protein N' [Clostridia bacterium]